MQFQRRQREVETFAGADSTYTIEAMMGDRKVLQAGTSHNLGQNFSRAFETQVVIVPIWMKDDQKVGVLNAAASVRQILQSTGVKVKLDDSDQRKPGWKYNFWEMKGVPLRIEIGPRDISSGSVVVSRSDIPGKEGKAFGISMDPLILVAYVRDTLDELQSSLLERAKSFRDSNIVDVNSYEELKEAVSLDKWARGPWSASDSDESRVREETGNHSVFSLSTARRCQELFYDRKASRRSCDLRQVLLIVKSVLSCSRRLNWLCNHSW